jgi:glycine cleavage system H protein
MNPTTYKYTKDHEWLSLEGKEVKIGITDYAQKQLGDIVYVDLPVLGTQVQQFGLIGEIESKKAVVEFFAPVSGKIIEINQAIIDNPHLINIDPYGAAWLVKLILSNFSELNALMTSDVYDSYVNQLT